MVDGKELKDERRAGRVITGGEEKEDGAEES